MSYKEDDVTPLPKFTWKQVGQALGILLFLGGVVAPLVYSAFTMGAAAEKTRAEVRAEVGAVAARQEQLATRQEELHGETKAQLTALAAEQGELRDQLGEQRDLLIETSTETRVRLEELERRMERLELPPSSR